MAGLYSKDYGRGVTIEAGEELKGVDVVWTEVCWWDYVVLWMEMSIALNGCSGWWFRADDH